MFLGQFLPYSFIFCPVLLRNPSLPITFSLLLQGIVACGLHHSASAGPSSCAESQRCSPVLFHHLNAHVNVWLSRSLFVIYLVQV
jgi:hypothetical protein